MKKINFYVFATILVLITFSCTNYIKTIHTEAVPDSENITKKLFLQNETLDINFYGDYIFNKVEKKFIFFTNKDVGNILNNLKEKPSSQVLFTYTRISIYNNMLGFYYAGKTLADIKNNLSMKTPEKEMQNGLLYSYEYNGYYIMEIYRQTEKGVVRFISVNNSAKQTIEKFRQENIGLFFDINSGLLGQD